MRAKLYICVLVAEPIEKAVISQGLNVVDAFIERVFHKGIISFSTNVDEIEFDDLGAALLEYCKNNVLPDLSHIDHDILGYMQVVPIVDDGYQLRVFLDKALLRILSERGLGLDIHGQ